MRQTSAAVAALLIANTQAHRMSKLNIHRDQLLDVGVRFATGMNGDEDLGQDITMKGEKFHYGQEKSLLELEPCNGSNGVVGLDCQSAWGYPKKTAGRPWAPMNDAYPAGHPRYASRAQMSEIDNAPGSSPQANSASDEDDSEPITPLPPCTGAKGERVSVDCQKKKAPKKKVRSVLNIGGTAQQFAQEDGDTQPAGQSTTTEEQDTDTITPLPPCTGAKGERVSVDCQKKKAPKKKVRSVLNIGGTAQQFVQEDDDTTTAGQSGTTEEQDTETITPLPDCTGAAGEAVGVDCKKKKVVKKTKINVLPISGLVQEGISSHHKHHHKKHHHHHLVQQMEDGLDSQGPSGDTGEHIEPLAPCTGAAGEKPGVDCRKPTGKKLKGCPGNVIIKRQDGSDPNCRVLPLCSAKGAKADACFSGEVNNPNEAPSLIQTQGDDKEEEKAFTYPKSNGFDLPELPECTGMNGPDAGGRKIQCRQIGRYTETGNWFVQTEGDDDKKDDKPNYKKLTSGTPQLPECTGMNGDRKGDADCRQIGRYNGPWPVTDDVQLKAIGKLQNLSQLPTCDQWITTNCQPVCTRDLTTGCTEARTPEPPKRDRFEGKWTHKPGQTTIQPRILPRDGVTNNYQH